MSKFNALLIHKDNTPLKSKVKILEKFDIETFDFGNSDLDTYISQKFIPKIIEKDFNIVFIKDNLSDNYLELYGITLAYHIRLSSELKAKRFIPIVIISDVDGYILNKLTPMANILFTRNTFVARNEITSYEYFEKVFEQVKSKPLSADNFKKEFLDLIRIDPPQDYLDHHGISNEWSIYRWAEFLNVNTHATKANKAKVENMLYFKYLRAVHNKVATEDKKKIEKPTKKGKVLLIDDEWSKGWGDILRSALHFEGLDFSVFEYNFEDKKQWQSNPQIKNKIEKSNPDVIILDLRLLESDHKNKDIESYTGIKILKAIYEINAGIQVIMLTATSKSTILEKLYEQKILGYIKKEHPEDFSIDTVENINKLVNLVDKGLEKKYLKEVFTVEQELLSLPLFKIQFSLNIGDGDKKLLELKNTISKIFAILDSNIPKPFVFAMLNIFKCLEIIDNYFIYEEYDQQIRQKRAYWIKTNQEIGAPSVENKTENIINRLELRYSDFEKHLKQIVCSRNYEIHDGEIRERCRKHLIKSPNEKHIVEWLQMVKKIINAMNLHGSNN